MSMRIIRMGMFLGGALVLAVGCDKEKPQPQQAATEPQQIQTVAQVHWLGMDRLGAETNATNFMAIWREPETRKLVGQTLDKLANWIVETNGQIRANSTNATTRTNLANPLLRPLLDDLVQAESYLKVQQVSSTKPGDLLLAIRLNPKRAGLWESNLASVLERTTGTRPAAVAGGYGWQAEIRLRTQPFTAPPSVSRFLSLWRSGDWTMLSLSPDSKQVSGNSSPPRDPNGVMRVPSQQSPIPLSWDTGGNWLKADFDSIRVSQALGLGWELPPDTPRVSLNATGDGENVLTRGELSFPQPLDMKLDAWELPTNLVHGYLASFTAARGVAHLLGGLKLFANFPAADLPNQLYVWGSVRPPFNTLFALPVEHAVKAVEMLASPITNWANPRIMPNMGSILLDPRTKVVSWPGLPHLQFFFQPTTNAGPKYVYGGFDRANMTNLPPLPEPLSTHILEAGTNLVYYNWEIVGDMILHWRYLDDVYRIAFDKNGPWLSDSASLQWIATNLNHLSFSATEVRLEQPERLSFSRKSTVGLDSLELEVLANWLELPQFPRGLGHLLETNLISIGHHQRMRPPGAHHKVAPSH